MNQQRIKQLQANAEAVRTGGKVRFLVFVFSRHLAYLRFFCSQGTSRRKKKIVHKTAANDDKKLQSNLKKLSVTNIPGM